MEFYDHFSSNFFFTAMYSWWGKQHGLERIAKQKKKIVAVVTNVFDLDGQTPSRKLASIGWNTVCPVWTHGTLFKSRHQL